MTNFQAKLALLQKLRNTAEARQQSIIDKADRENRTSLTKTETAEFNELRKTLRDLDAQVDDAKADMARRGGNDPETVRLARASMSADSESWATRAASTIAEHLGGSESRALISGSVNVPSLIGPVVAKTRPTRLIDVLINRGSLPHNTFEYLRQTVRTNNAATVADLALKPTSVFTVEDIADRARVLAHLSDKTPQRYWQDMPDLIRFLEAEMRDGLLDALEAQVISGNGTGENLTGLLTVTGTATQAYATDLPTTLRKAQTQLQLTGTVPTAYVLHPTDGEKIDLLRYSIDPQADSPQAFLLDGGYTNTVAGSNNVFGSDIQRVISPSVPAGTAVLGDFAQLQLLVREDMTLVTDTSGENFTHNSAVMRAEMRVGLAHLRPASFVKIDLTP
jgi:HK97 family phage major capsid protein